MSITQVISTLPTAPDPSTMTRDAFSTAAAASVLAQKAMVPELNTWTTQVNAIVSGTAGDIASGINGASAKTTPVDADLMTLTDSASSFTLKKLTWANLKATLGNTFAALAGSASQTFSVAAATAAAHAVRADSVMGRNKIINGRFQINQRAYVSAATLAAGVYGHDRFKAGASGGDYSFTQNVADTTITIASSKSLIQVIEDVNVSDTAYVLSWSGTAQARYAVNSATPAGSYAASPILITGQTVGTVMSIEFNTGTLGDIQLEAGTIATPFEHRHFGTELALCQRYLPCVDGFYTANCITTTRLYAGIPFPVPARVSPTGVFAVSGQGAFTGLGSGATYSTCELLNTGPSSVLIYMDVNAVLTAGQAGIVYGKFYFPGCEL